MTKEIWINLPVKDVNNSKEFFQKIGFKPNPNHPDSEQAASLLIGEKKVPLMLFPESTFKGFINHEVANPDEGTEVLLSIDAESREEVDELARKAKEAGGTVFGAPSESQGSMYGCGFTDLDGHRWNVLHMDFSKMPQG